MTFYVQFLKTNMVLLLQAEVFQETVVENALYLELEHPTTAKHKLKMQ